MVTLGHLLPIIYDELKRLAHHHLRYERQGHTLDTTALVHEAYLKLAERPMAQAWRNKGHFIAVATRAMRQILVDYARQRGRLKRGGRAVRLPLEEAFELPVEQHEGVLVLGKALERLEALNPLYSRVVECRYFGGLSVTETAAALEVSESTIKRSWRAARAWLYHEIGDMDM